LENRRGHRIETLSARVFRAESRVCISSASVRRVLENFKGTQIFLKTERKSSVGKEREKARRGRKRHES